MSKDVRVPFTKDNGDTATLLLAEAEGHEQGAAVVRTGSGYFLVPEEVAKSAGVDYEAPEEDGEVAAAQSDDDQPKAEDGEENVKAVSEQVKASESEAPAKKTAAKKTTAKKTAAKKTAAKGKE